MAANSNKSDAKPTGRAVLLNHYLFDNLWMLGDKKIPELILQKKSEEA